MSVATWVMDGYFHTTIWFSEKPCVETISFEFLDHARLHTWLPVSISLVCSPVRVSQNRMVRSCVPPPEASVLDWCGDHAIAKTDSWRQEETTTSYLCGTNEKSSRYSSWLRTRRQ